MMTEYEKASLLAQERSELRDEMVVAQKSLHSVLLGFATIIAAGLGLVSSKGVGDDWLGPVCFALSQLEFLLGVYAASLILGISAHAAYVRCIEDKINELAAEKRLLVWETEVGATQYSWPAGIFRWTVIGMACVLGATYLALIGYAAFRMCAVFSVYAASWICPEFLMCAASWLFAALLVIPACLEVWWLYSLLSQAVKVKETLYERLTSQNEQPKITGSDV